MDRRGEVGWEGGRYKEFRADEDREEINKDSQESGKEVWGDFVKARSDSRRNPVDGGIRERSLSAVR